MKKKSGFSKIMGAKGAGTVVTAFIGLIIIYIAFGILFYSFYCQERDE